MILKGNQRGGGQQLAAHLMNEFDNERVEVAEVRGTIAQDLSGSFAEIAAQGRATRIEKKYYYSLSLNPDPGQGRITRAQYFDLIDRAERSLKLVGQPRAVVFHAKEGREHGHVVWSRVNTHGEKFTAINISHDKLKLRTVIREFCRDHRLDLPDRMKPGKIKGAGRDAFNESVRENLGERQQKERTGIPKAERKADIVACWKETSNGAAFVKAMQDKGYYLGRGDQRDYVILDLHGEVHSLSRQLSGVARKKEFEKRLVDYPPEKQRDVETLKAFLKQKREDAIRKAVAPKEPAPTDAVLRRQQHQQRQKERRSDLDHIRDNLKSRHTEEREGLKAAQHAQNSLVVSARLQKQPRGLVAFLTRITGIKLIVEVRHKQQDKARSEEHKRQSAALERTHGRERDDLDRRYRALERLETRENRSMETALKREQFQNLVLKKLPQRVLVPEFEKASERQRAAAGGGGGGLSGRIGHPADSTGIRRGELQAAFERATAGKTRAAGDAGGGPAPADPEKTSEAQRLAEQLRRRQPRPGPDTDRDRDR